MDIQNILNKKIETTNDLNQLVDALYEIGKESGEIPLYLESDVARLLHHEEAEIRALAIRVLLYDWGLSTYLEQAEHMLFNDTDTSVRLSVLMAWASYYANSDDKDIMKKLLKIIEDKSQDPALRGAAYHTFLDVSTIPKNEWPADYALAIQGAVDMYADWEVLRQKTNHDLPV